jgi:hypothetical protein
MEWMLFSPERVFFHNEFHRFDKDDLMCQNEFSENGFLFEKNFFKKRPLAFGRTRAGQGFRFVPGWRGGRGKIKLPLPLLSEAL